MQVFKRLTLFGLLIVSSQVMYKICYWWHF